MQQQQNNTQTSNDLPPSINSKYQGFKPPKSGLRRHWLSITILVFWAVIAGLIAFNWRNIQDFWALHDYHAPAAIASLATQDTMTPYARKIFYVNHPLLESKTAFNGPCPNDGGEKTIVLGCYHSDQDGIFLRSVTDPLLNGVEQVTAAHEMLHAAYDRLSSSERSWVDSQLLDYYHHDLKDPRLMSTIAAYQKSEPNNWVNEMHSVFGTEVANLPGPLENYYTRYFSDRAKIAAYAAGYEAEFTSRQQAVAADDNQLSQMLNQINSYKADLSAKQNQINSERSQLMAEQTSDPNAYNAAVPGFNSLVDSYNSEVTSVQNLITQYNQLVAARNSIALKEDQLVNDLSGSTPSTAGTIKH